jgi:hypothetical protein
VALNTINQTKPNQIKEIVSVKRMFKYRLFFMFFVLLVTFCLCCMFYVLLVTYFTMLYVLRFIGDVLFMLYV